MSADEDTELRDLVAQALETNGVLGKIRAQLRASVFLALEEQESVQNKTPFQNEKLQQYLKTRDGQVAFGLVKEFLEHFNLDYTLAVFEPEAGKGDHIYEGRSQLARELNILEGDNENSAKSPLLAEVIKRYSGPRTRLSSSGAEANSSPGMVESKNKKNMEKSGGSGDGRNNLFSPTKSLGSEDEDKDPFFDDPLPYSEPKSYNSKENKSPSPTHNGKPSNIPKPGASQGSMTSLAGLPSLGSGKAANGNAEPDMEKDMQALDKRITDLGVNLPDDDYEDDFDSPYISPLGTARSQKSTHDVKTEEDIDEDIVEDLSVADDLLKSDNSNLDDLTTDRTVSPAELSNAFDYNEDVLP